MAQVNLKFKHKGIKLINKNSIEKRSREGGTF